MSRSEKSTWSNLIVESGAYAVPLSDDRFRAWMNGRQIFVSSLMDEEMKLFREAVRIFLNALGASPVMWEEITPQDLNPKNAYLSGVDRSSIFLLILGHRYGVTDSTGYSPTHQEANRAKELRKPRLLFTLLNADHSERDGRLNDWLNSLYNELSGASFRTQSDLVAQVDSRLREIAAQSERVWIKLGNLVFPGKVSSHFEPSGGGTFTVTARVGEGSVRRALPELTQPWGRSEDDFLTWDLKSYPIRISSVSVESEYSAEDVVKIICRTPQNWNGGLSLNSNASIIMSFGRTTSSEIAHLWVQRAILGESVEMKNRRDLADMYSTPDSPLLPDILRNYGSGTWITEGLVKLYVVEEVARRYGAQFDYLDISPAISTGVNIKGVFRMGSDRDSVEFEGFISR